MKLAGRFSVVCCLLLITTHRLPAPISEESPTPAPSTKPEASPHVATETPRTVATTPKPGPAAESTAKATPNVTQSIKRKTRHLEKANNAPQDPKLSAIQPPKPQASPSQSAFDGTWKGSINLVPARNWHGTGRLIGTFNVELEVAGDGTSLIEHCRNASVPEKSERHGQTI